MASGTVLVTGASTGIGEAAVLHLKTLGFDTVGAVRRDEDAERLEERGIRTVRIDVTDGDQIAAARDELGDAPLAGLVNNAGIAVAAPIEFLPVESFRQQLEVNLIGQLAVTQAFLPALRRAGGRVVNVSSIGGRVALPFVGPYAGSKFALEALSDSLRRELRPWGIEVSVIEPGSIATPMWDKGVDESQQIVDGLPPEGRELYGEAIIFERHRHRYEVNNHYREQLVDAGLVVSGTFDGGRLVEIVELPGHPWFVASQFHPEFKSRPTRPAPLFRGFVAAALARARARQTQPVAA
jgi:NAD(P)-dependent dehydrogenase (short-subunit alcohol dehydrogenase family)